MPRFSSKWGKCQVGRTGLAYLAPDIMSAIIKGNITATLTLIRLKKAIPLDWNEQRKLFSFNETSTT